MQYGDEVIHIPTGKSVKILEVLQFKDLVDGTAFVYLTRDFVLDIDFSVRFEPVVLETLERVIAEQTFPDVKVKAAPLFPIVTGDMSEYLKKASPREAKQITIDWPEGIQVTVGKGKTLWTVAGYRWDEVHLTREGKGRNIMDVSAKKLKKLK